MALKLSFIHEDASKSHKDIEVNSAYEVEDFVCSNYQEDEKVDVQHEGKTILSVLPNTLVVTDSIEHLFK